MAMKLLLHTCCGPCAVQCVETLREEEIEPELFWYNPNIHPFTEYGARKKTLIRYAGEEGLSLTIQDEYGLRPFVAAAGPGFENRCPFCYRTRLERTAREAAERGYDAFTSTLFISPYQKHELLKDIAGKAAVQYGVSFLYRDFRPRFREGQKKARDRGFYMQAYCGCIFSEEERYCPQYLTPAGIHS
jgi:predicted adenine nucleotide alpha hydrolase (AANH) superfamily ATPase